jgi:hypothetical protein
MFYDRKRSVPRNSVNAFSDRSITILDPRFNRCAAVLAFLFICSLAHPRWSSVGYAQERRETVLLFDFNKEKLTADWTAVGGDRIEASRQRLPASNVRDRFAPDGQGVTVRTKGNSGLVCRSQRVPQDWSAFDSVSFWVHRDAGEPISNMEVQFYEADGKARLWRKVTVEHTGWKQYSFPLEWCRWGEGRIPRWNRIDRFGFWFRDPAELSFDSITVSKTPAVRSDFLSPDVLAELPGIFGGERVRRKETPEVVILTNVAELEIEELANRLTKRVAEWRRDLGFLEQSAATPLLIVFATREQYEQFAPRLGAQFNSVAAAPQSDGYTISGIATSYWNEQQGTDRPVYTHELFHSFLVRTLRIDTKGEWLHEGLASMYQIRAHPPENMSRLVMDGLKNERFRTPFQKLCAGERIPENRYWQAATLLEMMFATPQYREKLPKLFASFQRLGATDLDPHLDFLDTTWAELSADWASYCQTKYGG